MFKVEKQPEYDALSRLFLKSLVLKRKLAI